MTQFTTDRLRGGFAHFLVSGPTSGIDAIRPGMHVDVITMRWTVIVESILRVVRARASMEAALA